MSFTIIRNTITAVKAEVIVNSGNPEPVAGGGAEGHIYKAAGYDRLLNARKKIGFIEEGEIGVTPAFALSAKFIFHTVSPVWIDGLHDEPERLRNCYRNALNKAVELRCRSIAFPLLASGSFHFPKELALLLAREEITAFLKEHDLTVILVVYDPESFRIAKELQDDVQSYIDAHTPVQYNLPSMAFEKRRKPDWYEDAEFSMEESEDVRPSHYAKRKEQARYDKADHIVGSPSVSSLEDIMDHTAESFSTMLLRMIDERGYKDSEVYKKANIDRKLFSKIRSNEHYHPKKNTVLSLALALELSLDETKDLLERAGYALSPSSRSDLILQYCIEHDLYDIYQVNEILFRFDQPVLGL